MGTIEKKTQGKLMEMAAQALTLNKDKYFVNIDFEFTNDPKKIIALAGSLVVDMTFRN
ncbi:hypothetical protein [Flavobacterium sp.]|uniref:hypothetical protein n=1 Tax=Flavobacterium sp. TaxID=239 RepID=UPI003D1197B4